MRVQCYISHPINVLKIETQNNTTTLENNNYTKLILGIKDTVFRLALSLVGNRADAEDVAQDVYEKVWRARDTVLSSDYPRAYVCRITHNMSVDKLRQQQRRKTISLDERQITNDGNREANIKDMAALTSEIIASLPPKQRMAIHLRDVEGYEMAEIAEILECDEAGARVNLSRARKMVREQLTKAMNYGV
jgi:RNA polymerase sigma-70 factor (ECF subfamily)